MSITIIDVAKKAGVSPSTVSRVISNHPRISPATAKKVKEIMEELGYHPNIMAKCLVSKTTSTLGILLPRQAEELFVNPFFSEVIRGIATQSSRANYDLLMTTGASEREELDAVTRLVRGRRVDGIILLYSRKHDPVIEFLHKQPFPYVLIGRTDDYPDVHSIDNNNVQAAYDAAHHLVGQGHTKIGFVSGPPHATVSKDRLEGYCKAMKETGLSVLPEWIIDGDFLQESGFRAMSSFMSLADRPTGLITFDDVIAFGAIRGVTELGYKVPDDLSIVGFNNLPLSQLTSPPISSIDISIYQLGYTASQLLLKQIKNDPIPSKHVTIPHRLVIRESSIHQIRI